MILNLTQLYEIRGGLSISGTLINSLSKAANTVLEIGRALGSAIRRIISGKVCKL